MIGAYVPGRMFLEKSQELDLSPVELDPPRPGRRALQRGLVMLLALPRGF